MPTPAPPTAPILSPQWAKYFQDTLFIPDMWRGTRFDFFTLLATNNGASRKVVSRLVSREALYYWDSWQQKNPSLVGP